MSKARTLANLISDNAELADGQISVAEVVGAAPTASPTFTGTVNADAITMSGFLTVNGGADFNTVLYPDGIAMADSRTISFGTSADFEVNGGSTFLDFNLKDDARHLRIKNGLVEHHRFSGDGSVIFNESGADADFRVESDSNTHMLFVDASLDHVLFGTSSGDIGGSVDGFRINAEGNALSGISETGTFTYNYYGDRRGSNNEGIVYGLAMGGFFKSSISVLGQNNSSDNGGITLDTISGNNTKTERVRITSTEAVFNEVSTDTDFRVESNNHTHMLFVNGGNDRVGVATAGPDAVMDVNGDFKANYYRPLSATTQTSNNSLHFWKLGRLYLVGADAAEIVLHGTKQGYGTGGNIVGKTTILLRGGTSTTALDGIFYSEGQTSAATPPEVRYVPVGNNSFDIYVRHNTYSSLAHTVTTGGSWTPSLSDTGTGTAPSNSIAILAERSFWLGNSEVLKQNQTETVINETGHDHNFRVESNNNTHALVVNGGNSQIVFGGSSISSTSAQVGVSLTTATTPHIVIGNTQSSGNEYLTYYNRQNNDGGILQFRRSNATKGSVDVTTYGTTYNTTSDRRLKDNIQPIADATDKLMSMKPVTHTWIADPEAPSVHGFIAQEMQEIVPEAVSGEDGGEEMMSMDYGRITPVLVAALQEATNEIKALKKRVSELEAI